MRDGKIDGQFDQRHSTKVVGLFVAGRVCRHVGQDKIRRTRERSENLVDICRLVHIAFEDRRPINRLNGQKIDADHFGGAFQQGDLNPPAGRTAKVNDPLAAFQDVGFLIDLE